VQALKVLVDMRRGKRKGAVYVFHALLCVLFSVLGLGIRRYVVR
jgi:hypothetical protein